MTADRGTTLSAGRTARPRVGLCDNTINAAYVTAKLLRRNGYDAELVEEPGMPFNQQPFWEDTDLALPSATVARNDPGSRFWRERARETGWRRPSWVHPPRGPSPGDAFRLVQLIPLVRRHVPAPLLPFGIAVVARMLPTVSALSEYPALLVQGAAAIPAFLSGRRYAVMTIGWDVNDLPKMIVSKSPLRRARAWLQRAALTRSVRILSMPAHDRPFLRALGIAELETPFPAAMDVAAYNAVSRQSGTRDELLGPDVALRTHGKVVFFCPSRIEFAIKGTDRLIHAFARLVERGDHVFLLMVDWGRDVPAAKELVARLGIAEHVHFLPYVMSRVRLLRVIGQIDVVVDQFILTAYGSLTRDALACGKPVVCSYDPGEPQPHPASDPAPILTASEPDEIVAAMSRLLDPMTRVRLGEVGRLWLQRNHEAASIDTLTSVLEELERTRPRTHQASLPGPAPRP